MEVFYLMLYLFCFLNSIDAYKVLVVCAFPVRSINLLGEAAVRHLLNAGHEVTYVTAYPLKDSLKKNFKQIDVSSTQQIFSTDENLNIEHVMRNPAKSDVYNIQKLPLKAARIALRDRNLQKLLEDTNETFDVVVSDYIETELFAGFAAVFDCPMVWLYSMGPHTMALRLVDQPANPSYAADYLTEYIYPMGFVERMNQFWTHIQWYFLKWAITMPNEEEEYKRFFGPFLVKRGRILPGYHELVYNSSLMLCNDHQATGNAPATPQNFKYIGGFHIEEPVKPLPQKLQNLMDNAKHGVIYFSMGSMVRSNNIPTFVKQALLSMLGELKQTVIWKFEEDLEDKPPNIHIVNWAPQHSILAHPNLLFFISHGGQLSSIEAVHFGVPVIGVPVFFDQFINVAKAVANGYALTTKLDLHLADNLKPLIQEMLINDKYKKRALQMSWIYHNRPMSPGSELVHWVEHVIKTEGAPHLRSPALQIPFYQKYYLDLFFFVIVFVISVIRMFSFIFRKNNLTKKKMD